MFIQRQKPLCVVVWCYSRRQLCDYFSESNEQTCFSKNCKLEELKRYSFALTNKMEKWITGQRLTNLASFVKNFTLMDLYARKVIKVD